VDVQGTRSVIRSACDEGTLAQPDGPNDRRDQMLVDVDVDVVDRELVAVENGDVASLEHGLTFPTTGRRPAPATSDLSDRYTLLSSGVSSGSAGKGQRFAAQTREEAKHINTKAAARLRLEDGHVK